MSYRRVLHPERGGMSGAKRIHLRGGNRLKVECDGESNSDMTSLRSQQPGQRDRFPTVALPG